MIEQLETRRFLAASVANGVLSVTGTDHTDRINVVQRGAAVIVHEGKAVTRFGKKDHIQQIIVNAMGGNDRVRIVSKSGANVDGGDGKDLIIGGAGSDVLLGGNGNDRIFGRRGNDSITGGAGRDALFGGGGDDTIDAVDTEADQVTGGRGNDSARVDSEIDNAGEIEHAVTDAAAVSIDNGTYVYTGYVYPGVTISDFIDLASSNLNGGGSTFGGSGLINGGLATFLPETGGSMSLPLMSPGSSGIDNIPVTEVGGTEVGGATTDANSGLFIPLPAPGGAVLTASSAVVLGGTTERSINFGSGGFLEMDSDPSMFWFWTPTGGSKTIIPNNPLPPAPQEAAPDPAVITAPEESA